MRYEMWKDRIIKSLKKYNYPFENPFYGIKIRDVRDTDKGIYIKTLYLTEGRHFGNTYESIQKMRNDLKDIIEIKDVVSKPYKQSAEDVLAEAEILIKKLNIKK